MFRLFLAWLVLLATVAPAPAGCYRRNYSSYYEVQEVFIPVAVPVVQPVVFQLLPALNLPAIIPAIGVNPVVATPPVAGAPGQQPVGRVMSEAEINAMVEQRIAAKQFSALRNSEEGPPPVPDDKVGAAAAPAPAVPSSVGAAVAILKASCISCHTSTRPSGGVTLFDAQGNYTPSVDADTILDAVQTARMPKTAGGNTKHPSAIRGKALATLLNGLK
jgi:mono/diheme cytochrome c family protein